MKKCELSYNCSHENKHERHIKQSTRWLFSLIFISISIFLIKPFMISQLLNRASSYTSYNLYPEAIRQYKKVLIMDKRNNNAWNWLAYSYKNEGYLEEAIQTYKEAIKINPENRVAHFNLGMIFVSKKDYKKAIQCFEQVRISSSKTKIQKAINMASYHKSSLNMLSTCYERLKDFNKAIIVLEELTRYYPNDRIVEEKLNLLKKELNK
ncbi:MAG: tetratricopeptide repeat protein [bacterium]|nr:tetratricopeptide repeat protein [bacterium]